VSAIASDFSERYQILIANTETLRRKVYRVRHQVFCSELGYDMQNVRGHEFDEYDAGSLHVLLRQRDNGVPIGCFRLVMPQSGSDVWLPFDRYGVPHVDDRLFDWSRVNRARSVEVSRLALSPQARKCGTVEGGPSDPYMATAMFYAVTALVLKLGTEDLFMVIEPRLGRLISRYGFSLDQISPPFEYYGQRATFSAYRSRIVQELAQLKTPWRNLYDVIENQLFSGAAQRLLNRDFIGGAADLAAPRAHHFSDLRAMAPAAISQSLNAELAAEAAPV
jgi:N-acyl amino acid synthase of PEP-CTERM/exosortase system